MVCREKQNSWWFEQLDHFYCGCCCWFFFFFSHSVNLVLLTGRRETISGLPLRPAVDSAPWIALQSCRRLCGHAFCFQVGRVLLIATHSNRLDSTRRLFVAAEGGNVWITQATQVCVRSELAHSEQPLLFADGIYLGCVYNQLFMVIWCALGELKTRVFTWPPLNPIIMRGRRLLGVFVADVELWWCLRRQVKAPFSTRTRAAWIFTISEMVGRRRAALKCFPSPVWNIFIGMLSLKAASAFRHKWKTPVLSH